MHPILASLQAMGPSTDTRRRTALGPVVDEDVTYADPRAPDLVQGREAPGSSTSSDVASSTSGSNPLDPPPCITTPAESAGA